jgi:hypothetical protein
MRFRVAVVCLGVVVICLSIYENHNRKRKTLANKKFQIVVSENDNKVSTIGEETKFPLAPLLVLITAVGGICLHGLWVLPGMRNPYIDNAEIRSGLLKPQSIGISQNNGPDPPKYEKNATNNDDPVHDDVVSVTLKDVHVGTTESNNVNTTDTEESNGTSLGSEDEDANTTNVDENNGIALFVKKENVPHMYDLETNTMHAATMLRNEKETTTKSGETARNPSLYPNPRPRFDTDTKGNNEENLRSPNYFKTRNPMFEISVHDAIEQQHAALQEVKMAYETFPINIESGSDLEDSMNGNSEIPDFDDAASNDDLLYDIQKAFYGLEALKSQSYKREMHDQLKNSFE